MPPLPLCQHFAEYAEKGKGKGNTSQKRQSSSATALIGMKVTPIVITSEFQTVGHGRGTASQCPMDAVFAAHFPPRFPLYCSGEAR